MNNLKKARVNKKLTQIQAAKMAGLSYSLLAKLEQGNKHASYRTMIKLSRLYDKSVEFLFFNSINTHSDKKVNN